MLEIKNQELKTYNIDLDIDNNLNVGIFSDDLDIIKSLSLLLAGINKGNIYEMNENIYDNDIYFKSRIFINNELNYLNTLNADKISSYYLKSYSKAIDADYFKALVKATKIRLNAKYKFYYVFDDHKNSLANNILALSFLSKRIIYKAFTNIDDKVIKEEYKTKKETIFLDDIKDIKKYLSILDNIIIFYKERMHQVSKDDQILKVLKNEDANNIEIIKNLLFEEENYYYVLATDTVKSIKKLKYDILNINNIGEKDE